MAKRYFDTDIWKKKWFRSLSPKYKSVWWYIISQCDHAGFFEPDIEIMSIFIGEELDEKELMNIFEKIPMNNFVHKVVLSISSLLIIIASIQFGISQYLLANGELAEATLVEFKEIRSADRNSNSTSYAPVYEYMNKFNKNC